MDALEAIRKRRTVRNFTGAPIPKKDLETMVDAARLAPSGYNRQPWDFIVITDREMINRLKVAAQWMKNAGAVIAVVLDPSTKFWLEDGSAAIENLLIACTALGYGSCWLEGYTLPLENDFKSLLGVPSEKRLLTLVPIGVPVEWPTKEKKSLEKVIHWERYQPFEDAPTHDSSPKKKTHKMYPVPIDKLTKAWYCSLQEIQKDQEISS